MTTSYLSAAEEQFLSYLKEDYLLRNDKSFFTIMFLGCRFSNAPDFDIHSLFPTDDLHLLAQDELPFRQTQWLFESMEGLYVGKLNDYFMGTGSEGEYFRMCHNIHNLPYYIIDLSEQSDSEQWAELLDRFQVMYQVNLEDYLHDYEQFCWQLGLNYEGQEI